MKILVSTILVIMGFIQVTEASMVKIEKVSVNDVEALAQNCSTEHETHTKKS